MASVFTNMGVQPRKGSSRLDPLEPTSGRNSPLRSDSPDVSRSAVSESAVMIDLSRSGLLPPLGRSHPSKVLDLLDGPPNDVPDGHSPTRRARKKHLLAHGDGGHKTLIQTTIDIDQRERDMALVREGRREAGRALLEMWVDQVLDPRSSSDSAATRAEAMKVDPSALRGLTTYGLTRAELQNAGLPDAAIDRLYRGMYVYTVGFFDIMQDMLQHSGFRAEVLANVWKGFLSIAESALSVGFRSDYLQLFQQQQLASAELLVAKEALAEARQDSSNTEKAISWLTAAHAEERALRQAMKLQLEVAAADIDREHRAHTAAVAKYTEEMEARAGLQLQVEAAATKIAEATAAQVALVLQRDALQGEVNQLDERMSSVHAILLEVLDALGMEASLTLPPELAATLGPAAPEGASRLETTKQNALAVRAYMQQMYAVWTQETMNRKVQAGQLYECRDALRRARHDLYTTQHTLQETRTTASTAQFYASEATAAADTAAKELAKAQEELADLRRLKAEGDEEIARLRALNSELETSLRTTSTQRNKLQAYNERLDRLLSSKAQDCNGVEAERDRYWGLLQEVSKGLAVSMRWLAANQAGRMVLRKLVEEERRAASEARTSASAASRMQHVLSSRVEQLNLHLNEVSRKLEVTVEDRQAGEAVLADTLVEVERRKGEIMRLQAKATEVQREVDRLEGELMAQTMRATAAEEAEEVARAESVRLSGVIKELDAGISASADDRMRLVKKVERLVVERRAADERAHEKLKLLQAEVDRRDVQLAACNRNEEALTLEVELQRKRMADASDLLERKRVKKRKWKSQWVEAERNLEHVRGMITEKDEALAAIGTRIVPIETDLAILVADRGRELAAAPTAEVASPSRPSSRAGMAAVPGAMHLEYQRHDQGWKNVQELQSRLVELNHDLDAARRDYEKARALFYNEPKDAALRATMLEREAHVGDLRAARSAVEDQLGAQAVELRAIAKTLQAFEKAENTRRLAALAQRTASSDMSMRSELSTRLDEAEARARELSERLAFVMKQYEDLQSTADRWLHDSKLQEGELHGVGEQLSSLSATNAELESTVTQYRAMISYMQSEVAQLTKDKDKLHKQLTDCEARNLRLSKEVEAAGQAASIMIKRVEEHFADDRRQFEAAAEDTRQKHEGVVKHLEEELQAVRGSQSQLEDRLRSLVVAYFKDVETNQVPRYLYLLQPCQGLLGVAKNAVALVPSIPICTGIDLADPLAQYIAPSYDMLLPLISQIYLDKILVDCKTEEALAGGRAGERAPLESIIYDFFMSRCGVRAAAELHISAFLHSVVRCRDQHVKVRVFARLLGAGPEAPLPPGSTDFYLALLNRVHARAGPLVNEAVEGHTSIKCKFIAKAAREVLKGPYANQVDEVASLPDNMRAMAKHDDDEPIDMEAALELAVKAFASQHKADLAMITSRYRHAMAGQGRQQDLAAHATPTSALNRSILLHWHRQVTPDEFSGFLRQLDPAASENLDAAKLMEMYRWAQRASGLGADSLAQMLCQSVLQAGYVGISAHHGRLEPVKATAMPPYDEFRLLEECWKAMRNVVQAQLGVIETRRSEFLNVDAMAYQDLCRKLELLLERRADPGASWALYRRILLLFTQHKAKADSFQPFKPNQPVNKTPSPIEADSASGGALRNSATRTTGGGVASGSSARGDNSTGGTHRPVLITSFGGAGGTSRLLAGGSGSAGSPAVVRGVAAASSPLEFNLPSGGQPPMERVGTQDASITSPMPTARSQYDFGAGKSPLSRQGAILMPRANDEE